MKDLFISDLKREGYLQVNIFGKMLFKFNDTVIMKG